jgi:hypothetical protein
VSRTSAHLALSLLGLTRPATALAAFLAVSALGCGDPPPRVANPTRALDERRAIQIIARAFQDERESPVPGDPVELGSGGKIEVDVRADGHKYGVAYMTQQERDAMGNALPRRDPAMGDALQGVRGSGDDEDARVLILYDADYMYDDQVGSAREETTITAESKLARDVRDYLVRAQTEQWP